MPAMGVLHWPLRTRPPSLVSRMHSPEPLVRDWWREPCLMASNSVAQSATILLILTRGAWVSGATGRGGSVATVAGAGGGGRIGAAGIAGAGIA